MRKTIKKYFIPQEDNNHEPHFLRERVLKVLVLTAVLVELVLFSHILFFSHNNYLASVLPGVLDSFTNKDRAENNLSSLVPNPILEQAAQLKANDMALKGYFAHTSPEGHEPWYWLKQAGYKYSHAGENLAVNFVDSKDVNVAWMNSPLHRANIVNRNYSEVGTAVAQGVYKGKSTVFIVQFFGTPQDIPTQASVVAVAKPVAKPASSSASTPAPALIKTPTPAPPTIAKVSAPTVLGAEVQAEVVQNIFLKPLKKIVTSPKEIADYIFLALVIFIMFALSLAVFIKIKIQRPPMIAGAIAVILVLAGFIYFNTSIISSGVELPSDGVATTILAF